MKPQNHPINEKGTQLKVPVSVYFLVPVIIVVFFTFFCEHPHLVSPSLGVEIIVCPSLVNAVEVINPRPQDWRNTDYE